MPSWITHLITANKICEKLNVKDKNSFLFGNVMPDILKYKIYSKEERTERKIWKR